MATTDLRLPTQTIVRPDKDTFLDEQNPFEGMMLRFDQAADLLSAEHFGQGAFGLGSLKLVADALRADALGLEELQERPDARQPAGDGAGGFLLPAELLQVHAPVQGVGVDQGGAHRHAF